MADLTYPREQTEEILDFNVAITKFENDYEQRRLIHDQALIGFKIRTPVRNFDQVQVIRDFFIAKKGAFTAFTFLSPIDDETYTVRFVPATFRTLLSGGAYVTEFELERVL